MGDAADGGGYQFPRAASAASLFAACGYMERFPSAVYLAFFLKKQLTMD